MQAVRACHQQLPAGPAGRVAAPAVCHLPWLLHRPLPPALGLQVYQEVGSDPKAFLGAALDYVAKQTSFFKQPGAAEQVAELAHRHATGGATAAPPPPPAAALPPAATPAAAQAPASAEPAQPEAAQLAAAAAAQAPAAPAEPAQEEDEEEGKGSGLSECPSLQPFIDNRCSVHCAPADCLSAAQS